MAKQDLLLCGADLFDALDLWSLPIQSFCCYVEGSDLKPLDVQKRFPQVFQGTGLCKKAILKLVIKDS